MYRSVRSSDIECEVDLYVAPSPRAEAKVVRVALAVAVVPCVIGWLLFHFVHVSIGAQYKGLPYGSFRFVSGVLFEVALFELVLLPIFPVRFLARLFLSRRKQRRWKLRIEGKVLRWMSSARSCVMTTAEAYCTGVRIGSEVRIVTMADSEDSPVSLRVRDPETLRLVESSLKMGMSSEGALEFPVWTGSNTRSGRLLQRSGLVLLLAGCWVFLQLFGEQSSFSRTVISIVISPLGLCLVLALCVLSWVTVLRESPAQKLSINAAEICIDGDLVCSLKDVIKLTITEDACLEIAASRIPEGKRLIKPWQPGYVDELELIKATIEAFQARAAENAPGASPPNPQP